MRFKISVMAVVVFGLMMATGLPADITGTWVAEMEGSKGGSVKIIYEFKADGANLTGTVGLYGMGGQGGETPISEGKIDGDNISFVVVFSRGDNEFKMTYKGTIKDDELELTSEMEGGIGGPGGSERPPIVAKRQK